MSKRPVRIFDTTLRDGEQSPGASMNLAEKMEVAQALVDLGVDIIEAGFPIASPGDFEAVREIAQNVRGSVDLRPGPLQRRGHRPRLGGPAARRGARGSTSFWPPAPSIASSSSRWTRRRSSTGPSHGVRRAAGYLQRHRVLARGRLADRARFSLPGGRSGDRRRRHDGQHSRHGRLCHAGAHGQASFARSASACRTSTRP